MDAAAKMIGNKVKIMDMDVATIVAAVWHGDCLVCTLKAEPEWEVKLKDIDFPKCAHCGEMIVGTPERVYTKHTAVGLSCDAKANSALWCHKCAKELPIARDDGKTAEGESPGVKQP